MRWCYPNLLPTPDWSRGSNLGHHQVTGTSVQRRLAAILAADVVGYSKMMGEDEAGALAAVRKLRAEVIEPKIAEHQGRLFKTMGDGFLVEFPSVVNAVACAVDIQKFLRNSDQREGRTVQLRIGINLGDVVVEHGDVFGDGVNVAARLESVAPPGGVAVSSSVKENVGNRLQIAFEDMGERALKNIDRPVRVFAVQLTTGSSDAVTKSTTYPSRSKVRLAVLPFSSSTSDPDQDALADGISEDILTELARFKSFFVIARGSSFSFKDKNVSLMEIAKILNVEYIVSGSVRRSGKRVRVAAQLNHAVSGLEVWAERYDREIEDIFAVQDEVVKTLVVTLESRLGLAIAENAAARSPPSLAAYECVQLAKKYNNTHDSRRAFPYIQRALEIDPNYALAHAILSGCHYVRFFECNDFEALDEMEAAARKAVALDNSESTGYAFLGMALTFKRQFDLAGTYLQRAMSLNPADTFAMGYYAEWLMRNGDAESSLLAWDRLLERDPISQGWYWENRGLALLMLQRYQDSLLAFGKQNTPLWYIPGYLAMCHARLGNFAAAKFEVAKLLSERPDLTVKEFLAVDVFRRDNDYEFLADSIRLAGLPE